MAQAAADLAPDAYCAIVHWKPLGAHSFVFVGTLALPIVRTMGIRPGGR